MKTLIANVAATHRGLLDVVLRQMAYFVIFIATIYVAGRFFSDSTTANVGIFLTCSCLFELAWHRGPSGLGRLVGYLGCLVGIGFFAFVLLRSGITCQASTHKTPSPHASTSP